MKRYIPLILFLLAWAVAVQAHTFLDHAQPRVGSTVSPAPTSVRIWFTQPLDPASCSIQVTDANGHEVDKKNTQVDARDSTLLTVSLRDLPAGKYQVNWRAASKDGHKTEGHFEFTVK